VSVDSKAWPEGHGARGTLVHQRGTSPWQAVERFDRALVPTVTFVEFVPPGPRCPLASRRAGPRPERCDGHAVVACVTPLLQSDAKVTVTECQPEAYCARPCRVVDHVTSLAAASDL
jgi:hypothetical protein